LQTPFAYALAQTIGLDPESVTYGLERERSASRTVGNPSLSLNEYPATDGCAGFSVCLQAAQGVFQHRQHQALDGSGCGVVAAYALVILTGHQRIRNHQSGESESAFFNFSRLVRHSLVDLLSPVR
jgi:hypothetical protein